MKLSGRTLFLYIDDAPMAAVFLESLLGKSFDIVALGEGESGVSFLEDRQLDWVIVDFDLPDQGAAEFIKASGRINGRHGFIVLSGLTVGAIAWERLHGLSELKGLKNPLNPQFLVSLLSDYGGKAHQGPEG